MKRTFLCLVFGVTAALASSENTDPVFLSANRVCNENKWGFSSFGDYLYWKSQQDFFDMGLVQIATVNEFGNTDIEEIAIPTKFPYQPGFRLGAAVLTPWDFAEFTFAWTQFHNHTSKRVGPFLVDFSGLAPFTNVIPFLVNGSASFGASADWKIHFRDFELDWSRSIRIGELLSITPRLGVQYSQIKEVMEMTLKPMANINLASTFGTVSNYFQGWGAKIGADGNWALGCGFNIFTNLACSLYWACIRSSETNFTLLVPGLFQDGFQIYSTHGKEHQIRPRLDLSVGVKWNLCIAKRVTVSLGAAYELHYFWRNFILRALGPGIPSASDLSLQGFTVSGGLQF